jgi:hypothetical protein
MLNLTDSESLLLPKKNLRKELNSTELSQLRPKLLRLSREVMPLVHHNTNRMVPWLSNTSLTLWKLFVNSQWSTVGREWSNTLTNAEPQSKKIMKSCTKNSFLKLLTGNNLQANLFRRTCISSWKFRSQFSKSPCRCTWWRQTSAQSTKKRCKSCVTPCELDKLLNLIESSASNQSSTWKQLSSPLK